VWGRQTSTLRPQGYSTGTLSKDQKTELSRVVRYPSLTLMTMTTPSTFYESLSQRYVSDGFLGRFLVVESQIGRQKGRPVKTGQEPSEQIVEWLKDCASARASDLDSDSAETPPIPVRVPFSPACDAMLSDLDGEMIEEMDLHERYGMEAMFGRTKEIAHRLALIVARSCGHEQIEPDDLQWAMDYATFYARRTVAALRKTMADGPFEATCKSVYAKIEAAGSKGVTERELSRSVRPFANMEPRRRKEVLEALATDRGVTCVQVNKGQAGKPRWAWLADAVPDEE